LRGASKRTDNPAALAEKSGMKLVGRCLLAWLYSTRSAAIFAAIPAACAVGIWLSWVNDNAVLREKASAVTASLTSDSAKISAINHWVYRNQGFAKNKRFFLVPSLGPTPNQVLESGGDCGDKSRLVSAMLWQLRINSGLAQIFPCQDCGPIHAVVEAEYEAGRMVVDPTWDVDYPTGDGKFLGIQELAGTRHGREHVADLQWRRGAGDKIQLMPESEATFDFAVAVNWQKNAFSRAVALGLRWLGYDPAQLLRPHFLEDPKLALALFLFVVAGMLLIANFILCFLFPGAARKFRPSFPRQPPGSVALGLHDKRG
jgi:hypothetical protein